MTVQIEKRKRASIFSEELSWYRSFRNLQVVRKLRYLSYAKSLQFDYSGWNGKLTDCTVKSGHRLYYKNNQLFFSLIRLCISKFTNSRHDISVRITINTSFWETVRGLVPSLLKDIKDTSLLSVYGSVSIWYSILCHLNLEKTLDSYQ